MTGRRIRRGLAVLAVVGIVGGGYAAYAASGSETAYRTAVATVGDVEQTLALAGTLEPSGRSDLEFGTDGTVAAVTVEEGDHVKAGQVLARLDRTSLTTAVRRARADLIAARAQLENDEDAQAETVSAASSGDSSDQQTQQQTQQPTQHETEQQETEQPATGETPSTEPDPALAELSAQQQAVTGAQTAASTAITAAKTALAAQVTACEDAYAEPGATPTGEPAPADDACATALTTVQGAQDAVATAQDTLQAALTDLAGTLTAAIQALGQANEEPTQEPTQETTEQPQAETPQAKTPTTQTPTVTVTPATLARDHAAIDQARAELVAAQQSLSAATVRAPHAGRVASVSAVVGDGVSAGDAAVTVIAPGMTTVELDATDTQVCQLEIGQAADVTAAGAEKALAGTVTAIGAVPDTSTGSTTYPVTITLDQRDLGLPSGATATVAVVVGTAHDVVTVPASAVRSGTVSVLDGGVASATAVTTGVVGSTRIEVTAGVEAGDRVVVADLTAALPTTDSESGGAGGFETGFAGTGGGPVMMRRQ